MLLFLDEKSEEVLEYLKPFFVGLTHEQGEAIIYALRKHIDGSSVIVTPS